MLQCIGKTKETGTEDPRCAQVSDKPNDPRWPSIYLCPTCANAKPNLGSVSNSNGIVLEPHVCAATESHKSY